MITYFAPNRRDRWSRISPWRISDGLPACPIWMRVSYVSLPNVEIYPRAELIDRESLHIQSLTSLLSEIPAETSGGMEAALFPGVICAIKLYYVVCLSHLSPVWLVRYVTEYPFRLLRGASFYQRSLGGYDGITRFNVLGCLFGHRI